MKSVLVCGGAGYIGSHMVEVLVASDVNVIVVDSLQTGFRKAINKKAKFYHVNIKDKEAMGRVFEENDIEGVVHFAANSLVGESMENPLKYYDNNVYGTQCLLEVMYKFGVNKIVFSSTAAVYGEPEKTPIDEYDVTNPTNAYGETKLAMEKMIRWADIAYGIKYVSLRYFNACGAHPSGRIGEAHNPETHLIPLILQVPQGKRAFISVFGSDYDTEDGTCIRDYVHVMDLVDAHVLALDYLSNHNESKVYNLGSGKGYSVKAIIECSRTVTGHEIPEKIEERRAGDPATLIASSDRIRNELGWKPNYESVEDIIETAWNWHKNNLEGFNESKKS